MDIGYRPGDALDSPPLEHWVGSFGSQGVFGCLAAAAAWDHESGSSPRPDGSGPTIFVVVVVVVRSMSRLLPPMRIGPRFVVVQCP